MARLPNPGEADWGEVLNEYLRVSHEDDGRLKAGVTGATQLASKSVTADKLAVREYYAPEDYGCSAAADAATNDAAIAAAIAAATAGNGVVQFRDRGTYAISKPIIQDVSKFVVRGNKTRLAMSSRFGGSFAWGVFSSSSYPYERNLGTAISGIILAGTVPGQTPLATAALQIGHETYTNNCLLSIDTVYISGFETGIKYIQNAWRVKVANCRVTGGRALIAAPRLANFGENLLVENCMIESYDPTITIGSGEWNFTNCSFNNTRITLDGDCVVKLNGCHLEPHTIYPCIAVSHPEATMVLNETTWIVDPDVTISKAAFTVVESNKTKGLIIRNLDTIQSANYMPHAKDTNCVLVSGGGRVDMQGYSANTNGYGFAIAKSNNLVFNGSAEKGNTSGWSTYASYGGPTTFGVDASVYRTANASFKLSTKASSIYIGQAVPCRPGQWVFAQCWNKILIESGTGGTFVSLDFLSAKNDVIATIGYNNTTRTTDWTCQRHLSGTSPVAPPGTAYVRIYIGVTGTDTTVAWYDEVIINVA